MLSLTKTDYKEKRKQDNLDEKAGGTSIGRRNKNASNKTGLLDAVGGTKLKDFSLSKLSSTSNPQLKNFA